VQEAARPLVPGQLDGLRGSHAPDAPSLEPGKHRPSDLEDLLVAPGQLPIAHPSRRRAGGVFDDLELPGVLQLVAGLPLSGGLRIFSKAFVAAGYGDESDFRVRRWKEPNDV
jgi:hypothetical protein